VAHPLCVTYKTLLFMTMVPKLGSVCLVSETALNRERVLKWGWMPLLQEPWGDNVQVWKHLHSNRSTFSAHREAMFLQNVVFVPESQIYHNSTGAFLSGSVYGMWPKSLLGGKQMFSLFLWWRDFKIAHTLPVSGVHLLCQCSHGNSCGTEGFVLQP
jgi:hypothetical protein